MRGALSPGRAIEAGLEVVSGLHHFLGDDPEFAAAAQEHRATIWDVRRPPEASRHAHPRGDAAPRGQPRRLFCGTDCNVGKMTASHRTGREAQRRGLSAVFAATGQTGIMISGSGIPADRFISDFVSGGVEAMVLDFAEQYDWVFVEGQGSLCHPRIRR